MYRHKLKSIIAGLLAAAVVALGPAIAIAKSDNSNSNAGNKVTICHATGSQTNPFVQITPNANGVVSGHINHQDQRDIIPPFSYNDHGTTKQFAGQNWDASGQATFNNGCVVTTGGQGGGPKDCDNDFDNSPAAECQTPTGGLGGGPSGGGVEGTTTAGGQGQVLGSTIGSNQNAQVSQVPAGSVNGGNGGINDFSLNSLQRAW